MNGAMEASDTRQANRSAVLWALLQRGTTTRLELGAGTGLSPATVSRVVDGLMSEGLVRDAPSVPTGRRGRRISPVTFDGDAGTVVGVDLGGSNCRFVAVDLLGRVRHRVRCRTPARMSTRKLAGWVSDRVSPLLEGRPLGSVAIGLPGIVDPVTSAVRGARNLCQVEGLAFVDAVREQVPAPVIFDNDSNMAVLGEIRLGAARGQRNVVMFTIGTGLGAGVVLDGRLLRGRSGLVGEFGYLPVGPEGTTLEALLSAQGLIEQSAHRGVHLTSPTAVFAPSAPRGLQVIRKRFSQGLVAALVAVSVAYEPDVVVLGGGVANALRDALGGVEKELRVLVPDGPDLAVSAVGDPAGAFGAVVAGLCDAYRQLGVDPSLLDGSVGPELTCLLPEPTGAPVDAG